ncbi:mechanosensitive ion channel protein 10-like [Durio zibethinus]|uniref:Mechanosensitive ion channel protein n=1 Tax=Durio zibethinus TaxID=66656 RepID=A0A6P5ZP79_DURZI|nr:mechanosensitive ion channel protein 10-like [Durio zibethinus]XP_022754701.1 mechanosensitive ion channel protein 10-like [Durio zibethinus]XP_022754702.1 mechanosensitive ion channel protein 10-like [Durio zibethinus]XP_022754703.1 mechanosensitive ion channel protein 10-like [Durio zibethinus]
MEAKDMAEKISISGGEVVINVSGEENPKGPKGSSQKEAESLVPKENAQGSTNKASTESGAVTAGLAKPVPVRCPSSGTTKFGPTANKPSKVPRTGSEPLTRRTSFAKPKSRFGEQSYLLESDQMEEKTFANQEQVGGNSPYRHSFNKASPNNKSARSIVTDSAVSKTLSMTSTGPTGENEYEEIIKKVKLHKEKLRGVKPKVVIEWVVFLFLLGCLIASLTADKLQNTQFWGLQIWKWCVLVMVIFCGMLVTRWFMRLVVFLIEINFLLQKKVLYFVHGLKKSVQVFIWLSLVLVTWVLLFLGVERSKTATKILDYVTWTLASILIGAFLWLLKTLLLKILASNFHMDKFFDRIQESVFYHYVLRTLSGPPFVEIDGIRKSRAHLTVSNAKKGKGAKTKKLIDMEKVHKLKREKVSSWHMKVLVDAIVNSGLSTISYTLDESAYDEAGEQADKEITNEEEAQYVAHQIFSNVARHDSNHNRHCIDEDDLLRFMIKEEVDLVFPLFEGSSTGKIDRKSFTNWVIKVYKDRKTLSHALNDTKTAVKQLNKIVAVILIIVSVIIWLLLVEIATTKVLLLLSSQLVVAAFMFGNTCKTIFEAIIFVFVMHPFDVGDHCVVDGVQLLVEEMNILTTVFLKLNNEKVYYPNSVLATKPISNYYRSPDMSDAIEFSIDFMTPANTIGRLKEEIKKHLEANTLWYPNHLVVVKEIENVNKLKMALYCNHTMNFQDFREKNRRRTELVLELKRIFEELGLRYNLLPQHVNLNQVNQDRPDATYATT